MSDSHPFANPKPKTFLLLAVALVLLLVASASLSSTALAGDTSGGISVDEKKTEDSDGTTGSKRKARYRRLWDRVSRKNKRWARRTSECESGGDPDAIGGGGRYRGAFQFMRSTWRAAPKSPGGDPIRFNYKTQAVVAVALKKSDGAHHWPNCG